MCNLCSSCMAKRFYVRASLRGGDGWENGEEDPWRYFFDVGGSGRRRDGYGEHRPTHAICICSGFPTGEGGEERDFSSRRPAAETKNKHQVLPLPPPLPPPPPKRQKGGRILRSTYRVCTHMEEEKREAVCRKIPVPCIQKAAAAAQKTFFSAYCRPFA